MSLSTPDSLRDVIKGVAKLHGQDPLLVEAIVLTESSGDKWAWNPEPRYRYFWDVKKRRPFRAVTEAEIASELPPADFSALHGARDQEWWAQQASWGLMQIMGAVARELGCTSPYLTALCDPITNLTYGCLKLAELMRWSTNNTICALAAYNGGKHENSPVHLPHLRNREYAEKVMQRRARVNPL